LAAFVMWRLLQAIFDADNEGKDREGLMTRVGQFCSGAGYAAMAFGAAGLLFDKPENARMESVTSSRETAETVMALPWGDWLLTAGGLAIIGLGI
ncbi:DUF1206 domain-containing protein, partial [Klebsiella pneumoniae]|uniref:DUF1206 domain-containing protein n=1 Tax=Klebsiella pneumoniae TaxID=573 RepID=UPI00210E36B5